MSTIRFEPLVHKENPRFHQPQFRRYSKPSRVKKKLFVVNGGRFCNFRATTRCLSVEAAAATDTAVVEATEEVVKRTFRINRTQTVEGKISVKLDGGKGDGNWELKVGCDLPGKWILYWGVNYIGDMGREWDQPPTKMRPPGSVAIKVLENLQVLRQACWTASSPSPGPSPVEEPGNSPSPGPSLVKAYTRSQPGSMKDSSTISPVKEPEIAFLWETQPVTSPDVNHGCQFLSIIGLYIVSMFMLHQ